MANYDLIIIGGGILGAACAAQLQQRYPQRKILLLEKEPAAALHQTGRNSGVIHAGVYYAPGSLKAQYCRAGLERTLELCQKANIPYLQCGKLLVATDASELERAQALFSRCQQNNLQPQWLDAAELKRREPSIRGVGGFYVQQTGITDYAAITRYLLNQFQNAGGEVRFNAKVIGLDEHENGIDVALQGEHLSCCHLVNCAGLMADRLINMLGIDVDIQILPFRGEYYQLPAKYNDLVKHLIYPIPDPTLPFLGVHLTRMIDGSVTVGPNAVLAFKREGYKKTDVSLTDTWETLSYAGFWPLIRRYWRSGLQEMKNSLYKPGYLEAIQKYCPQIQLEDLLPYRSGVRAQAVTRSGELMHDFYFVRSEHSLHLGNAPSPAATSALPIADAVVEKLAAKM